MKRPRPDQFAYINGYYGLSLAARCAVVQTSSKRRGQVARVDGAHIYIQWDGDPKLAGPYHPKWDLEYPAAEKVPA